MHIKLPGVVHGQRRLLFFLYNTRAVFKKHLLNRRILCSRFQALYDFLLPFVERDEEHVHVLERGLVLQLALQDGVVQVPDQHALVYRRELVVVRTRAVLVKRIRVVVVVVLMHLRGRSWVQDARIRNDRRPVGLQVRVLVHHSRGHEFLACCQGLGQVLRVDNLG